MKSSHVIDVSRARRTIAGVAIETPVLDSHELSDRAGARVSLKLENLQLTGSFKVRGAAYKMLSLSDAAKAHGVVACSSGNHGRAVAYVADLLGIPATIYVPEWVDRTKLEAMRRRGAETILHGQTYDEAEARSLEVGRERGLTHISPYDDPEIIAGQGTIGLELLEQLPALEIVIVPLSGGGLISGVAFALKSHDPSIRVIGVSAKNARVMYESLAAGEPIVVPERPTIANALAGGIGLENRHTFELVREYVDEHILVTEEEIRRAMAFAATEHRMIVEGGGAVGIAALLFGKVQAMSGSIAVVVSGGNVDIGILTQILRDSRSQIRRVEGGRDA